jgi:putative hydrolase of HD superfamily
VNETFSPNARLTRQITFLAELDKLKNVLRRGRVTGTERHENSAEHSWHLAMMALVLMEDQIPNLDQLRVLKMVLVHDIVEIDAGDTFAYDPAGNATKAAREQAAAERLFGLLPPDQAKDFRGSWDEFEAGVTQEAKLAQALDRLAGVLQNLATKGTGWRENGVSKAQVLELNRKIGETMPETWQALVGQLDRAEREGYFLPPKKS